MQMQLTQKETSFLKDLKEQEQTCVEKYKKYSSDAYDEQLKALFKEIGQAEQKHLNTINQIMSGTVPSMQAPQSKTVQLNFTPTYDTVSTDENKKNDNFLCTDLLSTEKHVSNVYNISIFEFKDTSIRSALNHIQKEEQEHGEQLYNYMAQNGMYN